MKGFLKGNQYKTAQRVSFKGQTRDTDRDNLMPYLGHRTKSFLRNTALFLKGKKLKIIVYEGGKTLKRSLNEKRSKDGSDLRRL